MKRCVVAISGQPGSGKTTLVRLVCDRLPDSIALHIDDYVKDGKIVADLRAWLDAGADFSNWSSPRMIADIKSLLNGCPIRSPVNNGIVEPASHIILESPAGRLASEAKELIDLVVFIDVPNEIAVARQALWASSLADGGLNSVVGFLRYYLHCSWDLCVELRRQVMPAADIVLNGQQAPEIIADELTAYIKRHVSPENYK